ncbi:MAG: branched-chain amino acid ABC transporter permease [Chitinispirillaceae bacterium]|nr:branched-chain amino acid ABC transporter permease [Chitinispirillaceae bacterium]
MFTQLLFNSLIAGSIYTLIALGFSLIYRTVRFFNFAHGVIYTCGAYAAYAFINQLGFHPAAGFICASVCAGVVGSAVDAMVYKPLRRRKAPYLVLLIASLGAFIFLQNVILLIYSSQIVSLNTGPVKAGHLVLGGAITDMQIVILCTSLLLFAALTLFVRYTRLGKAMRAVSDDTVAAGVVGINPERIIGIVFFAGSVLAGAAGILTSLETGIEPTMGMTAMLKGITAAVVGGAGSIPGAAFGGMLLGCAENFGIWKLPAAWKDCIAFVILVGFLLVKPYGIVGKKD